MDLTRSEKKTAYFEACESFLCDESTMDPSIPKTLSKLFDTFTSDFFEIDHLRFRLNQVNLHLNPILWFAISVSGVSLLQLLEIDKICMVEYCKNICCFLIE